MFFWGIFSVAAVAAGQLRDGRGGEPAPLLPLQPLPAPLPGAEAGPGQRRLLRQAHPLGVHGAEDAAPGHQVAALNRYVATLIGI